MRRSAVNCELAARFLFAPLPLPVLQVGIALVATVCAFRCSSSDLRGAFKLPQQFKKTSRNRLHPEHVIVNTAQIQANLIDDIGFSPPFSSGQLAEVQGLEPPASFFTLGFS